MSRLAQQISKRLKEARAASGLTQEEVARRAGHNITAQYISRLERAIADAPRRVEVGHVAAVFGLTADDLMGFDSDEQAMGGEHDESVDQLERTIARRTGNRKIAIGMARVTTNWKGLRPADQKLIEAAIDAALDSPEGPEDISETPV